MSSAVLRSTIGDLAINAGSLHEPSRGRWVAVVEVHAATEPDVGSDATILMAAEDGTISSYVGRVRKRARSPGRVALSVTVVGCSKLSTELAPRDHQRGDATEIPAGLVARGICDDAGEVLADGVEEALDAVTLPHWARTRGTGAEALDVLCHFAGCAWRAQRDGKVWIGEQTWPTAEPARIISRHLEDGGIVHAPDGAELAPGTTVAGRRIDSVDYLFGGPVRAEARELVAGDADPVPDLSLYQRTYAARVVSQDAAGLLELVPDDARLGDVDRPLRGIAFKLCIPGARAIVPVGARVRVRFEQADPRLPYACDVDADPDAGRAFALLGDSCGHLSVVAPPGGGPCEVSITRIAVPGSVELILDGPGHKYLRGTPA